ncbi:MAG: hypothetical protein H9W81_07910 [Enterococcus sp.]|nr:hypothetical protein [Enterococcus sp.]
MELELKNRLRAANLKTVEEAQRANYSSPEYIAAGKELTALVVEAFQKGYSVQEIGDAQNGF